MRKFTQIGTVAFLLIGMIVTPTASHAQENPKSVASKKVVSDQKENRTVEERGGKVIETLKLENGDKYTSILNRTTGELSGYKNDKYVNSINVNDLKAEMASETKGFTDERNCNALKWVQRGNRALWGATTLVDPPAGLIGGLITEVPLDIALDKCEGK